MVTIRDVARLAGVSVGTVSNVLNKSNKVKPETAKRVMEAVKELNYVPNTIAKSLKTNKSNVVGVLVEDICAFSSSTIIDGICAECDSREYVVNLANLRINTMVNHFSSKTYQTLVENGHFKNAVNSSINALLSARICALIYIGAHPRDISGILPKLNIPVIYAYCYGKNGDCCVNYDDFQGAKLAVEYLIKQGHTKIALISGPLDSVPAQKRLKSYKETLKEYNIPIYEEYIRYGDWGYDYAYRECINLINLPNPPSAIFSMSDVMAYGVIKALNDNGKKVPQDVSVHGFDNIESSWYMNPPLTTVKLPLWEVGNTAAKKVFEILENQGQNQKDILIPCTHIIRNSVNKI